MRRHSAGAYATRDSERKMSWHHFYTATPTTVISPHTCVPKVATRRYRPHALSATSFQLSSSIDEDFHPGVIVWLPAVAGSVQNYKIMIMEIGSVS